MIANPDGPFINLARLNVEKYAADPLLNRVLFEYVFYHEGDIRVAHQVGLTPQIAHMQIAAAATRTADFSDWYWKNQLGKCYYRSDDK
jgi:tetratricopeptide repeat protein 8